MRNNKNPVEEDRKYLFALDPIPSGAERAEKVITSKGEWYDGYLKYIGIPIFAMFGVGKECPKASQYSRIFIAGVFGRSIPEKEFAKYWNDICNYCNQEARFIKRDPSKPLNGDNFLTGEEYLAMILKGASVYQNMTGKSPKKFVEALTNSVVIRVSSHAMKFSKIARFLLNGRPDEFWYQENAEHIKKVFPIEDFEIISGLLAATSIRTDLRSNVKKAFKAYKQMREGKIYDIKIGIEGNKKPVKSHFHGFLDGMIINLNLLKEGKEFGDGDKNAARKIRSFSEALKGKLDAIVADIWIMRTFDTDIRYLYNGTMYSRSPTSSLYNAIEWYLRVIGSHIGKEPRGVCAMLWSGIRKESNSDSTRYHTVIDKMIDHGLFKDLYGEFDPAPDEQGMYFKKLVNG
jgi:hypothetical protein